MICEDILHLERLEGLTLVAGEKGLDRSLKWLYFADVMECLGEQALDDSKTLGDWLSGGELIVITSERITCNVNRLTGLIRSWEKKGAAGIVINTGQIAPIIEGLSNELSLPLFELSWSLRLIDLSQIVCKAIMIDESNENSMDRLLASLLYTEYDSEDNLIYQASYFGFNLRQACRIAVFDIDSFASFVSEKKGAEEEILAVKKDLQSIVKHIFRKSGLHKIMSMIQSDAVIVLFPADKLEDKQLFTCCEDIIIRFGNTHGKLTASAGVGNPYSHLGEFKNSLREASKAVKIAAATKGNGNVLFYKDMGIMSVFSQIDREIVLYNYYKSILGELEKLDELHGSELCETLEKYLMCSGNASVTAEALFIHRNTLRYRLNKIKSVLNVDLENLNICAELINAYQVRQYLKLIGSKGEN